METIALTIFLAGIVVLLCLGVVTLFFGITADEDEDFPFHGKKWVRPVVVAGLVAVAVGWPVVIPNTLAGLALSAVFLCAAQFAWHRGKRA